MRGNGHGRPVVALDLDGTLGDYHSHFLRFAAEWFGRDFASADTVNPGLPLWVFMGIEQAEYRDCKLAYRQGGLKRSMPTYPGASALTQFIRHVGAEVWICTTRPYLRLDNIDPDTREWLRRHEIAYDGVIFDNITLKGSKYTELRRQAEECGATVILIVDDLPDMIIRARTTFEEADFKPTILLRDQPYNRYIYEHQLGAVRVGSCQDIGTNFVNALDNWRKSNAGGVERPTDDPRDPGAGVPGTVRGLER